MGAAKRINDRTFSRFTQPFKCGVCGKLTTGTHDSESTGLCGPCYDACGLENEHHDYGHPTAVAGCPACPKKDGES